MTVRRLGGSERKSEQSSGSGVAHAVVASSITCTGLFLAREILPS